MSATTRRGALRGASLVGLLGIPAAALGARSSTANPDAGLIALCDRIVALNAEVDRLSDEQDEMKGDYRAQAKFGDSRIRPIVRHGWELRAELVTTPATTLAGFRAKARIVRLYNGCTDGYATGYEDDAVAWSLANDLLGLPTVMKPDDEEGAV